MKIALIGATGFVGSAVLAEALQRGHAVTALARQPAKLPPQPGLAVVAADVLDERQVAAAVEGQDAVLSAYNPGWSAPDLYDSFLKGSRSIVAGVKRAGVKRLLVVGGAGSLYVAPGVQLVDTEGFKSHVPPNVVPGALAARDALNELRAESTLEWTFLSPPALLAPGERTGRYRTGADELLMNGEQPAGISVADRAVALLDELEQPRHRQSRFTVAA
ncbi:MAG: hypothetical protein RJA10_2266 [Pseudomonadota bacterium]